jgi:hypothetical protein
MSVKVAPLSADTWTAALEPASTRTVAVRRWLPRW